MMTIDKKIQRKSKIKKVGHIIAGGSHTAACI